MIHLHVKDVYRNDDRKPTFVELWLDKEHTVFLRYRPFLDQRKRRKVQLLEVRTTIGSSYRPDEYDLSSDSRKKAYSIAFAILWKEESVAA